MSDPERAATEILLFDMLELFSFSSQRCIAFEPQDVAIDVATLDQLSAVATLARHESVSQSLGHSPPNKIIAANP